ncbi:type II toxin-antitoxin system RelE/ParE family toxin [Candidatus Peregrinibacteria bacterium]|nr:type II toxin-antitoxin system RelE/ParE family toxin [Candidatus Peregrinibacteria bacterium]
MMGIEFKISVEKDLRKIDAVFHENIFKKIDELKKFPETGGVKKIQTLKTFYRMRVGDYRVIFQVLKNDHKIVIVHIRHRKIAYRDF